MKQRRYAVLLTLLSMLVAAMAGLGACVAPSTQPTVWLVPSLERVERSAAPGSATQIALFAARGEYESFQVAIRAPAGGLRNVRVAVSDLRGDSGQRIGSSHITLYREHYVYVGTASPDEGGSNRPLGIGWYADALIPLTAAPAGRAATFEVEAHTNQPVWVDVLVPRSAEAGRYRADVTVSSDQGTVVSVLELNVWDFELPLKPSLNSAFLIWEADSVDTQIELLRHRLMPLDVEAEAQQRLIDEWGLTSSSVGLWSEASGDQCTMAPAPSPEAFRAAAAQFNPALRLYNYSADEIDNCLGVYEMMRSWARNMHAAGIDNLVTMIPVPELYDDGTGSGRSAVDIWVLLPTMYDSAPERVAEVLDKGDEVWSYNALVQDNYSPKWEIDFAPINFRIQPGFLSQSLGLTGLLYWRVDLWTADPWNDVRTYVKDGNTYPGEGMLLYPGQQVGVAGVVPSMRLKWLRDGVEDYEYIAILKRGGCGALGLSVARSIAADWSHWTQDTALLESSRQQLGAFIASEARQRSGCQR